MILSRDKKLYIIFALIFILLLSFALPTFARYKNRISSYSNVWSGNIATHYKSGDGTNNSPYIISNGEELAYFSSQLENNNYEGVYFKLSNDILLNEGIFKYENDLVEYVIGNNTYYVNGNDYYDNDQFTGEPIGSINVFPSLEGFEGNFDGDSHTIFGYYNTDSLFKSLSGNISSLYIENAFVNGSNLGILSDKIIVGSVRDILIDGIILDSEFNDTVNNITDLLGDYENLSYSVNGGITAYSSGTSYLNCISKVKIYGGFLSGGLIGYAEDVTISNSYNTGDIDSYLSNGIGVLKGESSIDHFYNTGSINGGLIGYVIDSNLDLSDSFIPTDNDLVIDSVNSNVSSSDVYYTYPNRGNSIPSILVTDSNLKDKTFLTHYEEFSDFENLDSTHVWVFEDEMYPVLYIDDVVNSYSELHINTYTWNSYSPNLDIKNINTNISFVIDDIDNIHVTDKYYYVSNSKTPLSKSDLENVSWTPYNGLVRITDEGFYVVYVKVVDNNSKVSYINSDLLVLDNSGSDITISAFGNNWTSSSNNQIFIDHSFDFTVSASDTLSGVKSIEYYLSNTSINDMSSISWITYNGSIPVSHVGEYILYVKVTDGCDFITYLASPVIVYDGYVVSNLSPLGRSGNSITSNSSITFNVSYSNNKQMTLEHNLISSVLLPVNTKITMIDKINNKVYQFVVDDQKYGFDTNGFASYPLSLFTEKGRIDTVNYVDGSVTNERFTFIVDFSDATISHNYDNVSIYLEGTGTGVSRPSIVKGTFSISSDGTMGLSHVISSDCDESIIYNSDSETDININSIVNYGSYFDTSYFGKKIGLAIKVVDESGNVVNKEDLKNIIFKVDGNVYTFDSDNVVRVNLDTNSSVTNTLSIITHQCSSSLEDGTYYIRINPYYSYDGKFYSNVLTSTIDIPLVVSDSVNTYDYSFDVLVDQSNSIINQGDNVNLSFNVLEDSVVDANIKVSMYKKDELTAFNQDYTLIDMGDYTDDSLDLYIDSVYYVSRNPVSYSVSGQYNTFNINLDTSNLEKTCYKFVFDLYEGNRKISSVSKYIIVR